MRRIRPRISESKLPAGLENSPVLIHYHVGGKSGSFVGRCTFRRRRVDDQILVTITFPDPRPEAFQYWKFLGWLYLTESDLETLSRPASPFDAYDYELRWGRQHEPSSG